MDVVLPMIHYFELDIQCFICIYLGLCFSTELFRLTVILFLTECKAFPHQDRAFKMLNFALTGIVVEGGIAKQVHCIFYFLHQVSFLISVFGFHSFPANLL